MSESSTKELPFSCTNVRDDFKELQGGRIKRIKSRRHFYTSHRKWYESDGGKRPKLALMERCIGSASDFELQEFLYEKWVAQQRQHLDPNKESSTCARRANLVRQVEVFVLKPKRKAIVPQLTGHILVEWSGRNRRHVFQPHA